MLPHRYCLQKWKLSIIQASKYMTIDSYTPCYLVIDLPSTELEKLSILAHSLSAQFVSDTMTYMVIFLEIVTISLPLLLVLGTGGHCNVCAYFFCFVANVLAASSALALSLTFLSIITSLVVITPALISSFQLAVLAFRPLLTTDLCNCELI